MSAVRISVLVLSLLAPATTAPASTDAVDAVTDCVKSNQPSLSAEQEVTFRVVDRLGAERVSNAKIYWQKFGEDSKALVRFSAPPDLRGSALLLLQKGERSDMLMYLPELQKVRRVTKRSVSGSMFGTDFSYEDFERFQGLTEDGAARRLPDAEVGGRKVFVVEGHPARGDQSAYDRVVTFVDQEWCVPIRTELYEQGERLSKVMVTPSEKIEKLDAVWVPRVVTIEDVVDATRTELTVDEIEIDKKLPRKLFSERELVSRGR